MDHNEHWQQRPDEPIDWTYWRQMGAVHIWEAVLLALNINPRSSLVDTYLSNREIADRVDIAESHAGDLEIDSDGRIRLTVFADWARKHGWKISKGLLAIEGVSATRDEQLQQAANELARQWKAAGKKVTKRSVAEALSKTDLGNFIESQTIERRLKVQW